MFPACMLCHDLPVGVSQSQVTCEEQNVDIKDDLEECCKQLLLVLCTLSSGDLIYQSAYSP